MNKEYQSKILLDLVEQKENLTKQITNRKDHIDGITNNGLNTKEEMKKEQARCEKKSKRLSVGTFANMGIAIIGALATLCTMINFPLIADFLGCFTAVLVICTVPLALLSKNYKHKSYILIKKMEHLEDVEEELENATKKLEKVMEDIQSLSPSDVELAQLEASRDKAQAMLHQFLARNTDNTKQNKAEEETTNAIEEDELGTK